MDDLKLTYHSTSPDTCSDFVELVTVAGVVHYYQNSIGQYTQNCHHHLADCQPDRTTNEVILNIYHNIDLNELKTSETQGKLMTKLVCFAYPSYFLPFVWLTHFLCLMDYENPTYLPTTYPPPTHLYIYLISNFHAILKLKYFLGMT